MPVDNQTGGKIEDCTALLTEDLFKKVRFRIIKHLGEQVVRSSGIEKDYGQSIANDVLQDSIEYYLTHVENRTEKERMKFLWRTVDIFIKRQYRVKKEIPTDTTEHEADFIAPVPVQFESDALNITRSDLSLFADSVSDVANRLKVSESSVDRERRAVKNRILRRPWIVDSEKLGAVLFFPPVVFEGYQSLWHREIYTIEDEFLEVLWLRDKTAA